MSLYAYLADVLDLHDADTMHVQVDLGFDVRVRLTVRLAGVNAPELATPAGRDALAFACAWLHEHAAVEGVHVTERGWRVLLRTVKDRREKYGRYLATVLPPSGAGQSLNDALLAAGHATPYGERRQ